MAKIFNYFKFCIIYSLLLQRNSKSQGPPDASEIVEYMDLGTEPCDNFYKFSCGNFLITAIIPENETMVDTWTTVKKNIRRELRILIEENISPEAPRPFQLVKTLYQNCMENKGVGLPRLLEDLKKLGGWPVLEGDSWSEENFDWKETVYKFRKVGYSMNYFFNIDVRLVPVNTIWYRICKKVGTMRGKLVLSINQPSLGISPEDLANGMSDKEVKEYYENMVNTAINLGANKSRAEIELKESLEFEIQLAKISLSKEEQEVGYLITVKELSRKFKSIPWKEFFNRILKLNLKIDETDRIIIYSPIYFKKFEKLIQQTPKRTQANYVLWRVTLFMKNLLAYEDDREIRQNNCIDCIYESLGIGVGALYIKTYFNDESKKSAVEMFRNIQQEFNIILKKVDWLDRKTRKRALEKLNLMGALIAYPDELVKDTILEKFYKNLEITPGDYLQSILNVTIFATDNSLSKLSKPFDKVKWIDSSDVFDPTAENILYANNIFLAAGNLQGYFFNKNRPQYVNYAALGVVIGHEITRGFDNQGRQFDKEGNYACWWELEATEKFDERAMCLIEQYKNYTAEEVGLNVDGERTLDENVADHGGLKAAYMAYQKWVDRNGPEPGLPDLNYTPSQLFWISSAHMFCTKYKLESLENLIRTDVHSPAEFRVLGPFSNSPEFAEDFQCPVGSKMNPEKMCSLW